MKEHPLKEIIDKYEVMSRKEQLEHVMATLVACLDCVGVQLTHNMY